MRLRGERMISRRGLITGMASLLAAPAIVRVASIMPVKAYTLPPCRLMGNLRGGFRLLRVVIPPAPCVLPRRARRRVPAEVFSPAEARVRLDLVGVGLVPLGDHPPVVAGAGFELAVARSWKKQVGAGRNACSADARKSVPPFSRSHAAEHNDSSCCRSAPRPPSRKPLFAPEAFVEALLKTSMSTAPRRSLPCRETKPDVYLMVITKVIPKELSVNGDGLAAFIKVWEAISSGAVEPLRDDQPVGDTPH